MESLARTTVNEDSVRLTRSGKIVRLALCYAVLLAMCKTVQAQVTVNTGTTNGNGVVMTEGTATAPSSGNDAIYAVGSPTHRLEVSNNGGSLQLLAVWPCTFTGCMVYASSATGNPETTISAGALGLPLIWGGGGTSIPGWGGTNLDIQANALVIELGTPATGYPSTHGLVILSGSPSQAAAATGGTTGLEGICISGCAASTTAQIAIRGTALCSFDSTTVVAGHYVQASTGTAGDCTDAGATYPINGEQVLGRALAGGSGGTTYNVDLYSGGTGSVSAQHLLNTSLFSDVTAASPSRGDGLFAIGSTPTWQHLAHPPSGGYFKWNGTDIVASTGSASGTGTCTNQAVTLLNADASPSCSTVTSAYVDNTIALTGIDINTSNQVTKLHPITSFGGTSTVNNGVPAELYATTSGTQTGSLSAQTIISTTPSSTTWYRISFYLLEIVAGSTCSSNTTIAAKVTFNDPNASSASTIQTSEFLIVNNGNANTPLACGTSGGASCGSYVFPAKASTAITYQTNYSPGSGCSPSPTYQITPILEQL